MKRKLQIAIMLTTALAGAGTLTSCKDYEEDLRNEWRQTNLTLEDKIRLVNGRLDVLDKAQQQCREACRLEMTNMFKNLSLRIGNDSTKTSANGKAIASLQKSLDSLATVVKNKPACITSDQVAAQIASELKKFGYLDQDGLPIISADKVAEMNTEIAKIAGLVTNYNALKSSVDSIRAYNATLPGKLADLESKIKDIVPGISKEEAEQIAKEQANKLFDVRVQTLETSVSDLQTSITTLTDDVNKKYEALNLSLGRVNDDLLVLDKRLTAAEKNAVDALNTANANKQKLEALQTLVNGIDETVDDLADRMAKAEGNINANAESIKANQEAIAKLNEELAQTKKDVADLLSKYNELEQRVGSLEDIVPTLASQKDLDALVEKVNKNIDDIAALQGDVAKLMKIYNRLNQMVTSIEIQRVVNPLFGSIATPIGIETNILVNYWGQYTGAKDLTFPSYRPVDGLDHMLDEADAKVLAGLYTPQTIKNNEYLLDQTVGLGTVYLTINPNTVNFTGGDLTLESSNGTQSAVVLRNVRRCDEELKFGYTRAANNGFYVADAYLPATAEAISKTRLQIVPGLETAVKDVVKDRTGSSIVNLMKKVYQQLTNGMPALGVKAGWTTDDGNGEQSHAVYSKYGIEATTFRPLSYNTLAGTHISNKFPTISPLKSATQYLDEFFKADKFKFDFSGSNINIGEVQFNFNLERFELSSNASVTAKSPGLTVTGTTSSGEPFTATTGAFTIDVTSTDLKPLIDDLNRQLNSKIDGWNQQMKDAFTESMNKLRNNINTEVNNFVSSLEGKINGQIGDIVNDIKGDVAGKLQPFMDKANKFIDLYNKVAGKLNGYLANPNDYLQVAMVYTTGGGELQFLSNDWSDPTVWRKNGGNGMSLFATSYTAEIVAPAYLKFVAITDIKGAGGSAKGGNATLLNDLKQLNAQGSMCKVLPGRQKRVAVPTAQMKSGYTYELVYTALDYRGYTSTQHFYITVK